MRTVLACGVFDLLHAGHIAHLKEASNFGGYLVVALTLDSHVSKEGRPIIPWEERVILLRELRCVDEVIENTDSAQSILTVQPYIFVKGSDYKEKGLLPEEMRACEAVGAKVRYTRPHPTTTTRIIERIRQ